MRTLFGLARGLLLLALLALLASVLLFAPAVRAVPEPGAALTALVARVSFNEALDSYPDAAMIWQATEGHPEARRYQWLRSHSPCVSGRLPEERVRERPGNCRFTRYLRTDGRIPRGWPYALGVWTRLRLRWLDHVDRVTDLVEGRDTWRPCEETPETWDGVRYGRERVEGEARRILECSVPYLGVGERGEGLRNYAVRRGGRS